MLAFLKRRQSSIQSAVILLMGAAFASRLLGLARDRILASTFGAGDELDIYFAAFRIPDLIYSILIAGAVSAAFIPVFVEFYNKRREYAWHLASNFLNVLTSFVVLFALGSIVAMPWLIHLVAPGFEGEKRELTILLARIMAATPILFGISSILSGVNQAFNRFIPYALAPIFYNMGIIFGAVILVPMMGLVGLAWGVVLGAVAHMIIQIPSARMAGFRMWPSFTIRGLEFMRMTYLMIPRSVGLMASQINLVVMTAIASLLAVGSVAVFNFANNLQYLVIGIIGLSYATASFPTLSHAVSDRRKEEFLKIFSLVVRQILFLVLPFSVLLFVLRAQVVRVVLGAGIFSWEDTRLTAAVLGIFCIGIFAHSLIPAIARAFYATQNTLTPVLINIVGIALNIVLSIIFVFIFLQDGIASLFGELLRIGDLGNIPLLGLPLAFALSGIITVVLLFGAFFTRFGGEYKRTIVQAFVRLTLASLISGFAAYGTLRLMLFILPLSLETFWGVFVQGVGAGIVGIAVYIVALFVFRVPERVFIRAALQKILRW